MPARLAWRALSFENNQSPPAGASKKPEQQGSGGGTRGGLRQRDDCAFISATVVSSMRFEKPHSLSFRDDTLTRRPDAFVSIESKFDAAGLCLKAIDTSSLAPVVVEIMLIMVEQARRQSLWITSDDACGFPSPADCKHSQ